MSPSPHFWTTTEDRALRQLYPMLGWRGVHEELPHRTEAAIVTRASTLRVRQVVPRAQYHKRRYNLTPELERRLRDVYVGTTATRGAVKRLAEETEIPHWRLKRWAAELGLSRPTQGKARPWTPEEDALLREIHGLPVETIQRRLCTAGHARRTLTAIAVRRRRIGVSSRDDGYYTACGVARLLGLDGKTVSGWCTAGWLEAERRETDRTPQQGGDMWWIAERELRQFVIDNPHRIDLRKVRDAEWLIHLIAGRPGDGRQHRRAKPWRDAA